MTDVWTPMVLTADVATSRTKTPLRVVARLRDGVTLKQAQADMAQLSERLGRQYPDTDQGWDVRFDSMR